MLSALIKVGCWVTVYYGWRPNLPDEADNHLIELAIASGADVIITHNIRDINRGELLSSITVQSPADYLETIR